MESEGLQVRATVHGLMLCGQCVGTVCRTAACLGATFAMGPAFASTLRAADAECHDTAPYAPDTPRTVHHACADGRAVVKVL